MDKETEAAIIGDFMPNDVIEVRLKDVDVFWHAVAVEVSYLNSIPLRYYSLVLTYQPQ